MADSTLDEIINPALIRTRNDAVTSLEDTSEKGRKALILYEDIVRTTMGSYPWPFLTKSVELDREGLTSDVYKDYRYEFSLPDDYWHIWNFYEVLDRRPIYGPVWDSSQYYAPFTYPLSGSYLYGDSMGRIIDGKFQSDCDRMYCLYTPRPPSAGVRHMDITGWTVQLREYVKRELMIACEQGLSADAEVSPMNIGIHSQEKKRAKTDSSRENRKAHRLTEPDVLTRMRSVTRGGW